MDPPVEYQATKPLDAEVYSTKSKCAATNSNKVPAVLKFCANVVCCIAYFLIIDWLVVQPNTCMTEVYRSKCRINSHTAQVSTVVSKRSLLGKDRAYIIIGITLLLDGSGPTIDEPILLDTFT